jgi:hypothetical protein
MSDVEASVDFRGKFLKLFGYGIIAVTIGVVVWGVISLGRELFAQAKHMRCQDNLKTLMAAISMYRETYHNQLPPHLAAVLPMCEGRRSKFQCPADPDHGAKGCRPEWLRRDDGDAFAGADLDGPTLDPERDTDRLPCSYLYVANQYPCGLVDFQHTWRDEFDKLVREHGPDVPMIRCYYHLPEQYVQDPTDPNVRHPDPEAGPTYNVTAGLRQKEYRLDWLSDPLFSGKGQ